MIAENNSLVCSFGTRKSAGLTRRFLIQALRCRCLSDAPPTQTLPRHTQPTQNLPGRMQVATTAKEAKNPTDCFMRSLYVIPGSPKPILHDEDAENVWAEGNFGHPAIAFKAAAVRAATDAGAKMTDMRRAFHIPSELVEIGGDPPKMRRDMVRVGMGTADVRFRGEFTNWNTSVEIRYNKGVISDSQICNLFRTAGFGVGVGEWRPEKGGQWGTFTVGTEVVNLGDEKI